MAGLELRLFGGFFARDKAGEAIRLAGQKDQALLAFLALAPGTTYSRDRLAALLWGDHGERQARDSLKQALLRLRRAFQSESSSPIVADRQLVALDAGAVAVDVISFEQRLGEGSSDAVEHALALYQGDLLEGMSVRSAGFEDWLLVERQRLRRLATDALAGLLSDALAVSARDRATAAARRLLSFDPVHEPACRALMRSHVERRERAQALKLFESLRDRLQQELAVQPEPETVALYQSIRQQRTASRPAGAAAPDAGQRDAHEAATLEKPTIAVLPFRNIGGDPEQDCFADGLTEDIITDLSQVSALFVVARHMAFTFKGRSTLIEQAAKELNVRYVLEGSVRKAGNCVRVTTQLVDAATGGHLWANRYDRSVDDIFALQDEISKSIVDVLRVKLLPEEMATIASRSTSSVEAYEYYLIGRSFYLRGIDNRSLTIARAMFAKASEIDLLYARAYAGIAICESYLMMNNPATSLDSILATVSKALEIEPNLADAHAAKGMVLYAGARYGEASAVFERAAALDPELFEVHFFHGRNCRLQGLRQRAAELFEHAAELRPNDFRSMGLLAEECKALGRREDFMSAARRCLDRVTAEVTAHPENADAWAFGSAILAELNQPARAEQWAARATMIGPDDHLVHYNVARTFAMIGQLDSALDWLDRAYSGFPAFSRRLAAWMKYDEGIEPLRRHPRFAALMHRLTPANDPERPDARKRGYLRKTP